MTMVFNKERKHVDVTKQMFIDFFKTKGFVYDEKSCNSIIVSAEEAKSKLLEKESNKKYYKCYIESGLDYSGINMVLDLIDSNNGIMNTWTPQSLLIQDYYDNLYKESQAKNKPAVIKTQKEFNINKPKYVNKPKELPEGQNVIITPYEEKKNSEVKPQETNKVLMYVPEYVKEADGKVTVETKAVEVPKEVIITPPPVAIEKPKEIQEVTDQVENQQQTQTVTTAQQPVQYAKSKITINSVINNPIFSVFTYLDTNYRKKHPLPPSPFGSLVAADPDYTKPQETARSMFVDWDFCDSNYGNNVTKIDYIEYSTFKLFTNAEFLKFIGQYNQQPLFKVYFDQNDERHLILIAEDENGIIQIDHNRFLNQNNTNVKYNSRSK